MFQTYIEPSSSRGEFGIYTCFDME